jgi:hypothetical protein
VGYDSLTVWDECDLCHAEFVADLAGSFEAFARPWLVQSPTRGDSDAEASIAVWKALVRIGLAIAPARELEHFDATLEWVANPEHDHDSGHFRGQGFQIYLPPAPIVAPFVALAQRVSQDTPWPYALFFLATTNAIFQTHLPLCLHDDDLDRNDLRGPELSMSLGSGATFRASQCVHISISTQSAHQPAWKHRCEQATHS